MSKIADLMKHYDNHDIVLISAYSNGYDHSENDSRSSSLRDDLFNMKYGYAKLSGRYGDNKADIYLVAHKVKEDGDGRKNFLYELSDLARRYEQTSIVYSPHNKNSAYVYGVSNVDANGNEAWPGKGVMHSIGHISDKFQWQDKKDFIVESVNIRKSFMGTWADFLSRREK